VKVYDEEGKLKHEGIKKNDYNKIKIYSPIVKDNIEFEWN